MKILAVDPGYDRLGIAVLVCQKSGEEELVYSDCFTTDSKISFSKRLVELGNELERIIEAHQPDIFASETLFLTKNQKTAMLVAGARGTLIYTAEKHKLPVFEYTPLQVKIAVTGYGKSDKKQVIQMVKKLIAIDKKIQYDDEYDAIAVALTCAATEKPNRRGFIHK